MKERLDAFLAKVREVTKNLSSKTKKIIILGVAISLIASIGIALWLNNKPYVTLFSDLTNEGFGEIIFVIGSSCGLSKIISDRADFKLSLSKMTFLHQFARLILTEQIYRAFKIIKGETYHK